MGSDKEKIISDLLTSQYQKYYRIAYSYVENDADALDVVQESAYKAIYNSNRLRNVEFADTWICRIVINEAKNYLKKYKNISIADIEEESEKISGKEDDYLHLELSEVMNRLPRKDREIIQLHFFEDMSLAEVAEVEKESVNTIKSRLYRCLKKMRIAYEG